MASSTPNTSSSTSLSATALPPDHLDHPESWATGDDPATDKQLGFVAVLEKQKDIHIPEEELEGIGKSEASELIQDLKQGKVPHQADDSKDDGKRSADADGEDDESSRKKRKTENGNKEEVKQGGNGNGDESAANSIETGEHLKHPETWATGADPATSKQKAFITVLEKQHPDAASALHLTPAAKEHLEKTKASQIIDGLKSGKVEEINLEGVERGEAKTGTTEGEDASKPAESKEDKPASKKEKPASDDKPASEDRIKTQTDDGDKTEAKEQPGTDEYLEHPEGWATGDDPATSKQLGYLAVLEKQAGLPVHKHTEAEMGKSEASERIEQLKEA